MILLHNEREKNQRRFYRDSYPEYAAKFLYVRPKDSEKHKGLQLLNLNRAQRYLHVRLEEQRAETGKVRAYILKGRQQGCSTYVAGRYYHRTTTRRGIRTFILTHEQEATANLFDMVERFQNNLHPAWIPEVGKSNRKELIFSRLDSGYRVGTAGTKGVGRSSTIQLFHGSEVAFWPHAAAHAAGILQAIPNAPGTEAIMESTANGMGNFYHQGWQQAEAGLSEFIAIFIPWYWQEEYQMPVPEGFALDSDEMEYQRAYKLTLEQMVWRRAKIIELKDPLLFKQEYPATPAEAFQTTGVESYLSPELVLFARKTTNVRPYGAHVVGVDPARSGDDRTTFIHRQGRQAWGLEYYNKWDLMRTAGRCSQMLKDNILYVHRMFVDVGGVGAGVVDRLHEISDDYKRRVVGVNFGGKPFDPEKYLNKRAEMYGEEKEWLTDPAGVSIPDNDELHADMVAAGYKYDSLTRLVIESKDDIKKRELLSPDGNDALALTFAEPVIFEGAADTRHSQQKPYDPLAYR